MRIQITIRDEDRQWTEQCQADTDDPEQWSKELIERFNRSLKPGEKPREYVAVEVLDAASEALHKWVKLTGGQSSGPQGSDLYRCRNCEITGKRYFFASSVKRDSKYRAKKYEKCRHSQEVGHE